MLQHEFAILATYARDLAFRVLRATLLDHWLKTRSSFLTYYLLLVEMACGLFLVDVFDSLLEQ